MQSSRPKSKIGRRRFFGFARMRKSTISTPSVSEPGARPRASTWSRCSARPQTFKNSRSVRTSVSPAASRPWRIILALPISSRWTISAYRPAKSITRPTLQSPNWSAAMDDGTMKMPEPIIVPMTAAMMLKGPRTLGRFCTSRL